jgi:hypothetical protein
VPVPPWEIIVTDAYPSPPSLAIGSHGGYDWLTTQHDLEALLKLCPELVLDKYLAVTSRDSGPLTLSDSERGTGWISRGGIAYSPQIESVEGLLRLGADRCAGFDEWYVFNAPVDLGETLAGNIFEVPLGPGRVAVFVNYYVSPVDDLDPSYKTLTDLFWKQLAWIRPESYIADGGTCLTVVSSDKALFATLRRALSTNPDEIPG